MHDVLRADGAEAAREVVLGEEFDVVNNARRDGGIPPAAGNDGCGWLNAESFS